MEFKSRRKKTTPLYCFQADNSFRTKPVVHKLPIPGDLGNTEKASLLVRAELAGTVTKPKWDLFISCNKSDVGSPGLV